MARPPGGFEVLEKAKELMTKTRCNREMRILMAVTLPLEQKLSIAETAKAVQRSPAWVSQARNEFIRNKALPIKVPKNIRNRAHMTLEQEKAFLEQHIEASLEGGILIVNKLHAAREEFLGMKVALSTTYEMLHRHNWRKLVPYKRHVAADVEVQEEFKKNSPIS